MRTAWLIVALLWPVALLNYLDRQMLASMKFSVMADIPSISTDANWGMMLGQFKWVYAFLSPIGGYIADRFSRRLTICGSLFVWSAVTFWTGQVHSYSELLVARSLMGISEAFYIPAALVLVADFHTGQTRSRAIGLHQMAIYCGVIAGGFGGYVADAPELGWRSAFTACGIFGMVYAVPLVLLLRDAVDSFVEKRVATLAHSSRRRTAFELLVHPARALLHVAGARRVDRSRLDARDSEAAIRYRAREGRCGGIAPVADGGHRRRGPGRLAGRCVGARRHRRGRIFVSAIGMGLIVPAMFGVGNAGTLPAAVMFLVLFGLGWGFFDGNNMPILCQIVRPQLRATGYGIMNFVSISCGGLADWGFGIMQDEHVPRNVIFGVFASAAIISALLVLLIRPRKTSGANYPRENKLPDFS